MKVKLIKIYKAEQKAYGVGLKEGVRIGREEAQREIRQALGIWDCNCFNSDPKHEE